MINIKLNKNLHGERQSGLVKTVIVIVIALIILGYFGFNISDIINGPAVQANLHAAWDFVLMVWNNYLSVPFTLFWNKFVIGVLWPIIQAGLPAK